MYPPTSHCPARPPWWLWPNRLALDAPCVAVVWQRFLADAHGVTVPAAASVVLGLVVWGIYLADRWLDAAPGRTAEDSDRHRFARRHRRAFGVAAGLTLMAVAVTVGASLPRGYLPAGGLVAGLLGVYFVKTHAGGWVGFGPGEKELAVGVLFSAGVAVPFLAAGPSNPSAWLPSVGSFAALCWLNCALIARWEAGPAALVPPKSTLVVAAGAAVGLAVFAPVAVAVAVVASVGLLGGLHLSPTFFSDAARRVLADAVLLTPLAVGVWT